MKIGNSMQLLSKIRRHRVILSAQISLTNRCNERCIHCLICKHPAQELNTVQVKDMLSQLKELNCMELTFTGGELMLRRDIFEILERARENGFSIGVFSNGTLINEKAARALKKAAVSDVQISLYGATAATHDAITRLPGSFRRTKNALRALKEQKIRFHVATIVMRRNRHEVLSLKAWAKKSGIDIVFDVIIRPRNDGNMEILKNRLHDSEIGIMDRLRPGYLMRPKSAVKYFNKSQLCIHNLGRYNIYISHDGTVFPHIDVMISLGNIKNEGLRDIWFYSKQAEYIRNLRFEDFRCSTCKEYRRCAWNPGLALQEHGSLFERPQELCRFVLKS